MVCLRNICINTLHKGDDDDNDDDDDDDDNDNNNNNNNNSCLSCRFKSGETAQITKKSKEDGVKKLNSEKRDKHISYKYKHDTKLN